MKRLTIILLVLVFALSNIASCGDKGAAPAAEDTTSPDTAAEVTETTGYADSVPQLDFEGAKFRTLQQNPGLLYNFYTDAQNGDLVNDVIFERIQNAEERLNIDVVETASFVYNEVSDKLQKSVLSGTDEYDLVLNQIFRSGSDAIQGFMYDWNTIPYINLSEPWYTKSIQDASLGECLYMIESDLSTSYMNQTWFILYNKKMAGNSGIANLYETVGEGKWTADYLYEIASGLYQDINGDGKADEEDVYGLATSVGDGCMTAAVYYAMNGRLVELADDNQSVIHVIEQENNINVLEKVSELLYQMPNVYNKLPIGGDARVQKFTSNKCVFVMSQVGLLIREELRKFEDDYGVLPLPKYDEAQSEYYTLVDGGADILTVPSNAVNTELIGAVVEIMSAFSYNEFVPTYMNVALEQKGTRDEESIKMLRSILDSRVIDFGYLYDTGSGWVMNLNAITKKPDAIISSVEKKKSSIDKYYTKIITQFNEN